MTPCCSVEDGPTFFTLCNFWGSGVFALMQLCKAFLCQSSVKSAIIQIKLSGICAAVRNASGSEGEGTGEGRSTPDPAEEEEVLEQGDTPMVFPVAPEDEARQDTPEASGPDENGITSS